MTGNGKNQGWTYGEEIDCGNTLMVWAVYKELVSIIPKSKEHAFSRLYGVPFCDGEEIEDDHRENIRNEAALCLKTYRRYLSEDARWLLGVLIGRPHDTMMTRVKKKAATAGKKRSVPAPKPLQTQRKGSRRLRPPVR